MVSNYYDAPGLFKWSPSWCNLWFPHVEFANFRCFEVHRNQHDQRYDDSVEDINKEEVDESMHPEHGLGGEDGDGVRLGQGQQRGHHKCEQVP